MTELTNRLYKTSDRPLVAWLRYCGFDIVDTILEDRRKVVFAFNNTEAVQKSILDYFNDVEVKMSPNRYIRHVQSVTDLIFQIVKNG